MKPILMPHPVLLPSQKDYGSSRFEMEVGDKNYTIDGHITIKLSFTLESRFMRSLVKSGKASMLVVVKCPKTHLRETVRIEGFEKELRLPLADYVDRIEISPYITSSAEINPFKSSEHHEEFTGMEISVPSGAILARGSDANFTIDSLQTISAAIRLITNPQLNDGEYAFDVGEDYIEIFVCEETRKRVENLRRTNQGVLYPSIYMAAITHALQNVTQDGTRKWEVAMRKTLEMRNEEFDEGLKDRAYKLAQSLLKYPLGRITEMTNNGG